MSIEPQLSQLYSYHESGKDYIVQLTDDLSDEEKLSFKFLIIKGERFGQSFIAEIERDCHFAWLGAWRLTEI